MNRNIPDVARSHIMKHEVKRLDTFVGKISEMEQSLDRNYVTHKKRNTFRIAGRFDNNNTR